MYQRVQRTTKSPSSEESSRINPFAPRSFSVPSTEATPGQPTDIQAQVEQAQQSGSNWPDVSMFTTNRPAPAAPPRLQMKLNVNSNIRSKQATNQIEADNIEESSIQNQDIQSKRIQPQNTSVTSLIQSPALSAGNDNYIQMLPLTRMWQEPKEPKYRHQALNDYIEKVLKPEIDEILEDTNGSDQAQNNSAPLSLWDLQWKSVVLREWQALQLKLKGLKGVDIDKKVQLVTDFAQLLTNPPLNQGMGSKPTVKPGQPRGKIEKIEPPSELQGIESGLFDSDNKVRFNTIGKLRKTDDKYEENQGAIYAPFIQDTREAVTRLVKLVGDSAAIFSLERGGALLADLIMSLGDFNIPNIKVPKEEKRTEHHEHLLKSMHDFIKKRLQDLQDADATVTIAVAETAVSGTSANKMLETLNKLLKQCPNVRIKLLLEKQTIKENRLKGKGVLRLDNPGIVYDRYVDADNMDKIEMFVSHTQYILGEDVGYQMRYAGQENADKPLIVFNGDNESLVACKITPSADSSARDAIIDLVSGVYDEAIANFLKK